jgi:Golgi SNAP receptor complex protein 1
MTSPSLTNWDEVKKSSRRVESLIYSKLSQLTKSLQETNKAAENKQANNNNNNNAATVNIAGETDADKQLVLQSEIENLLAELTGLISTMTNFLSSDTNLAANETNEYTLQRYRAILNDYSQEYRKTKETINNNRIRSELLSSNNNENSSLNNSLRPRTDTLLREKDSLHRSIRISEDLISQASEAKESLHRQANTFDLMNNKVKLLLQRFPVINNLMGKISTYKQRDMIIIASTIAVLLLFTFYYILNKP